MAFYRVQYRYGTWKGDQSRAKERTRQPLPPRHAKTKNIEGPHPSDGVKKRGGASTDRSVVGDAVGDADKPLRAAHHAIAQHTAVYLLPWSVLMSVAKRENTQTL